MKYEIQKLNEEFNVIILERDENYEYYLEKVGYGNLLHLFTVSEKLPVTEDVIDEYSLSFWQE